MVEWFPNDYLDELVARLAFATKKRPISRSTMCRELQRLKLTLKVITKESPHANYDDQLNFVHTMSGYNLRQVVWFDETGTNIDTTHRRRGRAPQGERCLCPHLSPKGPNFSTIGKNSSP